MQASFVASTPLSTRVSASSSLCRCSRRARHTIPFHPIPPCCSSLSNTNTYDYEQARPPPSMFSTLREREPNSDTEAAEEESIVEESLSLLEWGTITKRALQYSRSGLSLPLLLCDKGKGTYLRIPDTLCESLDLLQYTREAYTLREQHGIHLDVHPASDIRACVTRCSKGGVLSVFDLLSVYHTCNRLRELRTHILSIPCSLTTHPKFHTLLCTAPSLRAAVETELRAALDVERDTLNEAHFPELARVTSSISALQVDIRTALNAVMTRVPDAVQDRLITERYDRFVIPVKVTRKAIFKGGVVHDVSRSGGTVFIEPREVMRQNDQLKGAKARQRQVIHDILTMLSRKVVMPVAKELERAGEILAVVEYTEVRRAVSVSYQGIDVTLVDEEEEEKEKEKEKEKDEGEDEKKKKKMMYLPKLRHPVLIWNCIDERGDNNSNETTTDNRQNEKTEEEKEEEEEWKSRIVPATYDVGAKVRCVCVTGPNTGGKTLTLKTLGVCALLAKCGFFIPSGGGGTLSICDISNNTQNVSSDMMMKMKKAMTIEMPYFDQVLADIGDDQSLVQSLSTFSGHIRRIKRILTSSTKRSLVLLDEIGSGTDPTEGAALGMAVLRHLALRRQAKLTFATTHHGELKTLKYMDDGGEHFENASVEFDEIQLKPTYRLLFGIPGRSNALNIAQRLGLCESIIDDAKQLVEGGVSIEEMVQSLEREKVGTERGREEAEKILEKARGLKKEAEVIMRKAKLEEREVRRIKKEELGKEVEKAKQEISAVVKQVMSEGGASLPNASKARRKVEEIYMTRGQAMTVNQEEEVVLDNTDGMEEGDKVVVRRVGEGEVEVVRVVSKKEVEVGVGGMKMKVKVGDISQLRKFQRVRATQERKSKKKKKDKVYVRTSGNSVDVRGERVNEAVDAVERGMSKAYERGEDVVWVIHGHGTGRLKNGVRKWLAQCDNVERVRDADAADGGAGVTVIDLK